VHNKDYVARLSHALGLAGTPERSSAGDRRHASSRRHPFRSRPECHNVML